MEIDVRTIQLSDATYAALWAKWQEGDEGEEGVLRRLLGVKKAVPNQRPPNGGGYRDARSGMHFPEGFEIFRTFKGKEYRAVVEEGLWFNKTLNRAASSLNQLSAKIGAPTENAWYGWYFKDGDKDRLINELRDPKIVRKRVI